MLICSLFLQADLSIIHFFQDGNPRWTGNSRTQSHSVCYWVTFLQGAEQNSMERGNCISWRVSIFWILAAVWFFFFFSWKQMKSTLSLPCGSAWWTLEVEPTGRKTRRILSEFDLLPVRILLKSNKLCDSLCSEWTCKFCRKHIILEFLSSFWGSDTCNKIQIWYSWGFQVTLKETSRSGSVA